MKAPGIPHNETLRQAELDSYRIVDTAEQEDFDFLTEMAGEICGTPIALVSLITNNRQWFLSHHGLEARETPRDYAFCAHAIHDPSQPFIVTDARKDARFHDNPLVTSEPHVIFYAGIPLITPNGMALGTLCVIDNKPRELTDRQMDSLKKLARQTLQLLELRKQNYLLQETNQALISTKTFIEASEDRYRTIGELISEGIVIHEVGEVDRIIDCNDSAARILGLTKGQLMGLDSFDPRWRAVTEDGAPLHGQDHPAMVTIRTGKPVTNTIMGVHKNDRELVWIQVSSLPVLDESTGALKNVIVSFRDITVLKMVNELQSLYLTESNAKEVFEKALSMLLQLTLSEYGFIGKILRSKNGTPYLKTYALTDISWNAETREFFEKNAPGGLEFTNLNTLFGSAIITGKPVISNDPANDPRRGGLPPGHPPLNAFLGVPMILDGRMVGLVGIANRSEGYSDSLLTEIQPLTGTISRIIDAQNTKEELDKNSDFLKTIIESINDHFAVINVDDYSIAIANKAYGGNNTIGKKCHQVTHNSEKPCDGQSHPCPIAMVRETRKPVTVEHLHLDPAGNETHVEIHASPIFGGNGDIIQIIEYSHDITERKTKDILIQKNLQFQRLVAELSTRYVKSNPESFDTDVDCMLEEIGMFFQVDRSYLFLYKSDAHELSNTHEWCREGILPQKESVSSVDLHSFPWWSTQLFSKSYIHVPILDALPPEASPERQLFQEQGILSLICIPIRSGNRVLGFLGLDSVRKRYTWTESETDNLRILANNLGDLLQKHENDRLIHEAKEKAELAATAKSKFLATMSHEIRTPLNGIIGFTELLKNSELTSVQREYIQNVHASGELLLSVVNDILDYSKIEAGKLELDIQRTDLKQLLSDAISIIRYQAEQKGLSVQLKIESTLPRYVYVDPIRLKQILGNLLGNSLKFTETGSIELHITYEPLNEYKGSFLFAVRDTGIGISEENQKKLFLAFSQADSSTTRKYGGTGLGLAICSMLADKMNTRIQLISKEGTGSTFFFHLETKIDDQETTLPQPALDQAQTQGEWELPKLRSVLIVEDSPINMLLAKHVIHELFPLAQIFEAVTGVEAIDQYTTHRPDLIFMDINMPEMDGLEATQAIREWEASHQARPVPIFALTAGVLKEERDKCMSAGMNGFIPKPFTKQEMEIAIVQSIL